MELVRDVQGVVMTPFDVWRHETIGRNMQMIQGYGQALP